MDTEQVNKAEVDKNINLIESNIISMASLNNWKVTDNLHRIAVIKNRFFGLAGWHRCPCYPQTDTEHGCGTAACLKEITESGVCHCNLYKI